MAINPLGRPRASQVGADSEVKPRQGQKPLQPQKGEGPDSFERTVPQHARGFLQAVWSLAGGLPQPQDESVTLDKAWKVLLLPSYKYTSVLPFHSGGQEAVKQTLQSFEGRDVVKVAKQAAEVLKDVSLEHKAALTTENVCKLLRSVDRDSSPAALEGYATALKATGTL